MDPDQLAMTLGRWRTGDQPLYRELADAIAGLLERGAIEPGARLPAERSLAQTLTVSRGTVVSAYEDLRERGLAFTRHGSGTVVGDACLSGGQRDAASAATMSGPSIFSSLLHPLDDVVNMTTGDLEGGIGLPDDLLDLTTPDAAVLRRGTGYYATGLPRLREAIATWLSANHLSTDPDQVLVTTGAQQAISLLTQYTVSPGDVVVTEELTYPGAVNVLRAAEATVRVARHTPQGVDIPSLRRVVEATNPVMVYLVPDGHNPTGIVAPSLARRRLAELAAGWSGLVVEDASLWPTTYDGRLRVPIAGHRARRDDGVLVGSLSKIGWSGLRIGWVRGPRQLVARLARLKVLDDIGTPVFSQLVGARLLERADSFFPLQRAEILRRYERLAGLLRTHLPSWSWRPPEGGLVLWVSLDGEDATAFTSVAARHGVATLPGTVAAPGGGHDDHLRLPLCVPDDRAEEGVRRLAAAWSDYLETWHHPRQVRVVV